ncbi:hypothetical protein Tco_0458844 [Tanacetum coccineum]
MPPKRTSTSAAPSMTQAAIRQLAVDSVAAALETTYNQYPFLYFLSSEPILLIVYPLFQECMTRSSTKDLLTPFEEPERSEEEVIEAIGGPTMEEYMMKTREDYGSRIARPKFDDKAHSVLKIQFLKELRDNTFSGSDNEDAKEHIKKVLEIVGLFHTPNVTEN